MDRRTAEGKRIYAEAEEHADCQDKILVPQSMLAMLREMVRAVRHDQQLSKLHAAAIEGKTRVETTIVWESDGVLLKARLDQVTTKAIIDWKSTGLLDPEAFADACNRYNYHVQAAMYQDGWLALTGETLPFIHAVCGKRPPYPCWLHRIPDADLDHGRTLYQTLVRLYARQQESK